MTAIYPDMFISGKLDETLSKEELCDQAIKAWKLLKTGEPPTDRFASVMYDVGEVLECVPCYKELIEYQNKYYK